MHYKLYSEFVNNDINPIPILMKVLNKHIQVSNVSLIINRNYYSASISFENWLNTNETLKIISILDKEEEIILMEEKTGIQFKFRKSYDNMCHKNR